jgi:hypothetical protein
MANQQQQTTPAPAGGTGRKGEQDSHAAGSGSSTGDPGKARGPQPDDGARPIDRQSGGA